MLALLPLISHMSCIVSIRIFEARKSRTNEY